MIAPCLISLHQCKMKDQASEGEDGVSIRCEASGGVIDIPGCDAVNGVKVVE